MPRPVLLAVDDEPDVLRAVERDLRKQCSDRYRVLSADSGPGALDDLNRLAQRSEPAAVLVADHRMPRMNGIEFLTKAIRDFPDVRRVLLTATPTRMPPSTRSTSSSSTTTSSSLRDPPVAISTRCR